MSRHVPIPDVVKRARPWGVVRPVGPPPDSRGDIGTAEMQVTDVPGEYRRWYAHFKPTEHELAWLNAGGTIEMCQLGAQPQPFSVQCWGTGEPAPEAEAAGNGLGRCVMCGAERDRPCTVISGSGEPGDQPGDVRSEPHAGRGPIGSPGEPPEGFVPVAKEPNHYADQPHTAECGGPGRCPLPGRPPGPVDPPIVPGYHPVG